MITKTGKIKIAKRCCMVTIKVKIRNTMKQNKNYVVCVTITKFSQVSQHSRQFMHPRRINLARIIQFTFRLIHAYKCISSVRIRQHVSSVIQVTQFRLTFKSGLEIIMHEILLFHLYSCQILNSIRPAFQFFLVQLVSLQFRKFHVKHILQQLEQSRSDYISFRINQDCNSDCRFSDSGSAQFSQLVLSVLTLNQF